MREFGRMPERDEQCTIGRFEFKVLRADSRRIHLLQLNVLPEDDVESPSESDDAVDNED